MNCDELREDYEMYALGLAEEPGRSGIREHIGRACPTCTEGIREARGLAAFIGATAPPAEPPARLRARVLASVGVEPKSAWSSVAAWIALAASLAIVSTGLAFRERRLTAQVAQLRNEIQARGLELANLSQALSILNEPDVKSVTFGQGEPQPPRGRVFVHSSRGVLLIAGNLPPAPEGKIYEMWVIPKGGKPVPAGLFQSGKSGDAIHVLPGPVNVATTGAIAVTLESAAGAQQPTTQPLIVAAL